MDMAKQVQGNKRQPPSLMDETPFIKKSRKTRSPVFLGQKTKRAAQRKQLPHSSADTAENKPDFPGTGTGSTITTRSTTKAQLNPKSVADMVSAQNPDFASDLAKHGLEIRAHLEEHINTLPAERTCPMPGMARFVTEVTNFLETRVINDEQISDEERVLYRKLSAELHSLGEENYPWNRSFKLFMKSGIFISFYYRNHPVKFRYNNFFKTTTLQNIDALPWDEFYSDKWAPALKELRGLNLLSDDLYWRLSENISFFYPQIDPIDIEFFNKTWLLNIHPVGFFYDTPVLEFDGVEEDVATYQIHDPFHSLRYKMPTPWSPREHNKLQEIITYFERCRIIGRCTPKIEVHTKSHESSASFRLLKENETDFPPQALHLACFITNHEYGIQLDTDLHTETLKVFRNSVFLKGNVKRGEFSDLPGNYLSLSSDNLSDALLFLQHLHQSEWWSAECTELSEARLKAARQRYQLSRAWFFMAGIHDYWHDDESTLPSLQKQFIGNNYAIIPCQHNTCQADILYINNGRIKQHHKQLLLQDNCHFQSGCKSTLLFRSGDELHILSSDKPSIITGVKSHHYHPNTGMLLVRKPEQKEAFLFFLNGPNPKQAVRLQGFLAAHVIDEQNLIRAYTDRCILDLQFNDRGVISPSLKRGLDHHLKQVDFTHTSLKSLQFGKNWFESCDFTGATPPRWQYLSNAYFSGYFPLTEQEKIMPIVSAAQNWLDSEPGQFIEKIHELVGSGLLPFITLNEVQWHKLLNTSPWDSDRELPLQSIPLQAIWDAPDLMPDYMLSHAHRYLCDDSVLLSGKEEPSCNRGIKALIGQFGSHDDFRKFIMCNKKFRCDSLVFEDIKFNYINSSLSLTQIKLKGICFYNSDLSRLYFSYSEIEDCTFVSSNLQKIKFTNSTFENTVFNSNNAKESRFSGVIFKGDQSFIKNTDMTGATFTETNIHGLIIQNSSLSDSLFDRSDLPNHVCKNCDLTGITFK